MLKNKTSSAIIAVSDLARARGFYRDLLGLDLVEDGENVMVFRTGETHLVVYRSDEAGTNRANAVVWNAGDDLGPIVAALQAKGVAFEHYPGMDGVTLDGDVHWAGDFGMVWFKDPDGNILHINAMTRAG